MHGFACTGPAGVVFQYQLLTGVGNRILKGQPFHAQKQHPSAGSEHPGKERSYLPVVKIPVALTGSDYVEAVGGKVQLFCGAYPIGNLHTGGQLLSLTDLLWGDVRARPLRPVWVQASGQYAGARAQIQGSLSGGAQSPCKDPVIKRLWIDIPVPGVVPGGSAPVKAVASVNVPVCQFHMPASFCDLSLL